MPERERSRKRAQVNLACNRCRQSKVRCDATKPTCERCRNHNLPCVYAVALAEGESRIGAERRQAATDKARLRDREARLAGVEDAFRFLKSLPEQEATQCMQQVVRSDGDPLDRLVSLARGGARGIAPLPGNAAATVVANQAHTLRFELSQSHPLSYPALVAIDHASLPMGTRKALQFDLPSAPIKGHSELPPMRQMLYDHLSDAQATPEKRPSVDGLLDLQVPVPANPRPLCDIRLSHLSLAPWSQVPMPNLLAAEAISIYLETDHAILGFFDAQLFVRDLVKGSGDNCSPLLVSAVCFWSCQMYSSHDPEILEWGQRMLAEARSRWPRGDEKPSVLTVAAGYVLGYGLACCAKDDLATEFQNASTKIGHDLRLFGVYKSEDEIEHEMSMPPERYRCTSHIAWGAYNWLSLMGQYYSGTPPSHPPSFIAPGERGDPYTNGSPDSTTLPVYHIHTFTGFCQLRRIFTPYLRAYRTRGKAEVSNRLSLDFAEDTYQRMLAWADELEEAQQRRVYSADHTLVLHIWYHAMVIDVFRPFLGRHFPLKSFSASDNTPEAVVAASLEHIKVLVLNYRRSHASANWSILWHIGLLYVGNFVLPAFGQPDWHFYFMLCVNSYRDLSNCYRVAAGFMQGLLWIATRAGIISPDESKNLLQTFFNTRPGDLRSLQSAHIIDLDLGPTETDVVRDVTVAVRELKILTNMDTPGTGPAVDSA